MTAILVKDKKELHRILPFGDLVMNMNHEKWGSLSVHHMGSYKYGGCPKQWSSSKKCGSIYIYIYIVSKYINKPLCINQWIVGYLIFDKSTLGVMIAALAVTQKDQKLIWGCDNFRVTEATTSQHPGRLCCLGIPSLWSPSGNQKWQWGNPRTKWRFIAGKINDTWGIFHCYVWLAEGTFNDI